MLRLTYSKVIMVNRWHIFVASLFLFLLGCSEGEPAKSIPNSNNGRVASNNGTQNNGQSVPNNGVSNNNGAVSNNANADAILEEIKADLDAFPADTDFTFLAEANDGTLFSHFDGDSTADKSYRSASTSKWVSATVVLWVVQSGKLKLSDKVQDHVAGWPTKNNLGNIELRHLLAFTSGLNESSFCTNRPLYSFDNCIIDIANANPNSPAPGTGFYYGPTHMQVAGAMAISASGASDWKSLFSDFKNETGLFPNSSYDLPSQNNPRLAGGMHWTGNDYFDFLRSLYREKILTPDLIALMVKDHNGGAEIVSSPARKSINEDWHYGFGNWIECHSELFNCTESTRVSSPGAYGAYPFIDYENKYFGIVAREGRLGTFDKGYEVFNAASGKLEAWAQAHQ